MTIRRRSGRVALSALLVLGAATVRPATAQTFGVGGGVSQDPDQVFVQGLVDQRGLGTNGRLGWRPGVQLGFGNDLTTLAGTVDLALWIPLPNPLWSSYMGLGPSVNLFFPGGDDTDLGSDVGGGASVVAGIEHERGFFAELRFGAGRAAGLRLAAGVMLRR